MTKVIMIAGIPHVKIEEFTAEYIKEEMEKIGEVTTDKRKALGIEWLETIRTKIDIIINNYIKPIKLHPPIESKLLVKINNYYMLAEGLAQEDYGPIAFESRLDIYLDQMQKEIKRARLAHLDFIEKRIENMPSPLREEFLNKTTKHLQLNAIRVAFETEAPPDKWLLYTKDRLEVLNKKYIELAQIKTAFEKVYRKERPKPELKKPDGPEITLFAWLLIQDKIGVMAQNELSAPKYIDKVCARYNLPFVKRSRNYFSSSSLNEKYVKKLRERILPLLDHPTRVLIDEYLHSKHI